METMTKQGHLESAIYMARNVSTGDDEQTRIEDEQFLEELPPQLRAACEYLCTTGHDYDGACVIYVRWHLRQTGLVWYIWEDYKRQLMKACNTIFESLWDIGEFDENNARGRTKEELEEIEEDRDQIEDWMSTAYNILKAGA